MPARELQASHHPTGRTGSEGGSLRSRIAVRPRHLLPRINGSRDRKAQILPVAGNWYGTTLRVYDPRLDAWHVMWSDPATQNYVRQIGRARGKDIVQEGQLDSGDILRWTFTEITSDSFHWLGEHSVDGGTTWRLQVDIRAHRVAT